MSEPETYQLAKFSLDSAELPSPSEIADGATESYELREEEYDEEREEKRVYKHRAENPFAEETNDGYSYCHLNYHTDTSDSILIRSEDDEEIEEVRREIEAARVLYFENGQFVFESTRNNNLRVLLITQFISESTGVDIDRDDIELYSIPQEVMEEFYGQRSVVSIVRFSAPDSLDDVPDNSEVAKSVGKLLDRMEGLKFSVGRKKADLKGSTLIDESVEHLDVTEISGRRESELTTNVKSSGRVRIDWNEANWSTDSDDENIYRRAQTVKAKVLPLLRNLD